MSFGIFGRKYYL